MHHRLNKEPMMGCSDSEDTSSQCMSTDDDSDDDFFQYNDWHNGMNTVMPGQTADDTNRTVRNGNNNCAQCSAPANGNDTKSEFGAGNLQQRRPGLRLTVSVWIMQNVMKFRSQR